MKMTKHKTLPGLTTTLLTALAITTLGTQPILATSVSSTPMLDITAEAVGMPPIGDGSFSTIIREPSGVTINVHTNIAPGTYTVWLLVWNDPSRCTNAGATNCLPPPAGGADVPESIVFGTGQVVPSSGRGDFGIHLPVGDTDRLIIGGSLRTGLTNALGAEIHVILRHHGDALPDALEAQITTPAGACDVNTCADLQGGAHIPGAPTAEITRLDALDVLVGRVAARLGLRP